MNRSSHIEPSPRVILCGETAADLMTPNPFSLSAAATVGQAAAVLASKRVSAAPVIDEAGRPVGVLSQSDIVVHDREYLPGTPQNPEYYERADLALRPHRIIHTNLVDGDPTRVSDLMTPVVLSVAPETPAYKVVEEMLDRKVHRLFVVNSGGILVGVISAVDVLRHLRREPAARQ